MGDIQRNPARSAGIQRKRRLIGAIGRDFAPRGSVIDLVGSPGNPEKSPRLADPPPGQYGGIPARSAEIQRNRHLLGATGRRFASHGSTGDCLEHLREIPADPPFGGYCGQGEAIETNPAMSAGIQRKRHLFGATGRNFVPPGSAARFGRSSGNPENVGGPRIRCPACSAAKAGDSGNPHLVGRYSAHSPLTWRDRAEFRTTRTSGRLSRMSSRNPEKSRRFLDQPSDGR